jgi:tungstate transport system substrate-binding protein
MGKRLLLLSLFMLFSIIAASGLSAADKALKMATTTSTNDTGLLDYLAPLIKADTGIELQWVSVGTGMAITHGKNCDVDVLLVHDPDAEKKFMEEGNGVDHTRVMYNDFVIIGPKADPAGIKGKTAKDALQAISAMKAPFASRADTSGTNMKEISLWKAAGLTPPEKEQWYVQTGQGMLPTINVAAEKNGYTLTDRGTYIKYETNYKGNPPLVILVEGDKSLLNQYSVIPVNPKKCPHAKYDLAKEFTRWMASVKGQKLIGEFKLMKKQLFFPNAGLK